MLPPAEDDAPVAARVVAITWTTDPRQMRDAVYDEPLGALTVTSEWTTLRAFDAAADCERFRAGLDFQARAKAHREIERLRVLRTETTPTNEQVTVVLTAVYGFVTARASQCVSDSDPRLARAAPSSRPSLLDKTFPELTTAVIPFAPGQPIYVNVRFNGSARARLVLDTGADRTTITPRILRAVGLN